jgi:hypothetical protein
MPMILCRPLVNRPARPGCTRAARPPGTPGERQRRWRRWRRWASRSRPMRQVISKKGSAPDGRSRLGPAARVRPEHGRGALRARCRPAGQGRMPPRRLGGLGGRMAVGRRRAGRLRGGGYRSAQDHLGRKYQPGSGSTIACSGGITITPSKAAMREVNGGWSAPPSHRDEGGAGRVVANFVHPT